MQVEARRGRGEAHVDLDVSGEALALRHDREIEAIGERRRARGQPATGMTIRERLRGHEAETQKEGHNPHAILQAIGRLTAEYVRIGRLVPPNTADACRRD